MSLIYIRSGGFCLGELRVQVVCARGGGRMRGGGERDMGWDKKGFAGMKMEWT